MKSRRNDVSQWTFEDELPRAALIGRDWLKIALALSLWTFLALIGTTTAYIAMQGEEIGLWLQTLLPMSTYYLLWAAAAPLIYRVIYRGAGSPRRVLEGIVLHAALLVLITAIQAYLLKSSDWIGWLGTGPGTAFLALGVTIYVMISFICIALKYYRRALDRERAAKNILLTAKSIENELSLARLDMVSTQFRPHFLFNALNGITALIESQEYEKATEMVYRLGQLLRSTLLRLQSDESTLESEIRFISEFVDLQRLRAPGEIDLAIEIPPDLVQALVPPMILQPLVENSIKYADRAGRERVDIGIEVTKRDASLRIRIRDNGEFRPAAGPSRDGTGFGLKSIRERLQIHYGDAAQLVIGAGNPAGTVVTLELPLELTRAPLAA